MGLLKKIFRSKDGADGTLSQFQDSEPADEDDGARVAARRDLVQVVLRDTMRKHGIPSDWIECRIIPAVNRAGRPAMHLNLVVRQAHDRLIGYVFAFQDSFHTELARFEPRARDWLVSLGWEFEGHDPAPAMPDATAWAGQSSPARTGAAAASVAPPAAGPDPLELELPRSDEDIQRDLEKLFAIRDAAIADASRRPEPDGPMPGFENTQPFADDDPPLPRRRPGA